MKGSCKASYHFDPVVGLNYWDMKGMKEKIFEKPSSIVYLTFSGTGFSYRGKEFPTFYLTAMRRTTGDVLFHTLRDENNERLSKPCLMKLLKLYKSALVQVYEAVDPLKNKSAYFAYVESVLKKWDQAYLQDEINKLTERQKELHSIMDKMRSAK